MKNSPRRDRSLTMATLSQLAYLADNEGTEVVSHILKSGCPPFVQQYQTIEFLHAPRLFSSAGELVCCGFVLSTHSEIAIAITGTLANTRFGVNNLYQTRLLQSKKVLNSFIASICIFIAPEPDT
jgi:hypothetical protein